MVFGSVHILLGSPSVDDHLACPLLQVASIREHCLFVRLDEVKVLVSLDAHVIFGG